MLVRVLFGTGTMVALPPMKILAKSPAADFATDRAMYDVVLRSEPGHTESLLTLLMASFDSRSATDFGLGVYDRYDAHLSVALFNADHNVIVRTTGVGGR